MERGALSYRRFIYIDTYRHISTHIDSLFVTTAQTVALRTHSTLESVFDQVSCALVSVMCVCRASFLCVWIDTRHCSHIAHDKKTHVCAGAPPFTSRAYPRNVPLGMLPRGLRFLCCVVTLYITTPVAGTTDAMQVYERRVQKTRCFSRRIRPHICNFLLL